MFREKDDRLVWENTGAANKHICIYSLAKYSLHLHVNQSHHGYLTVYTLRNKLYCKYRISFTFNGLFVMYFNTFCQRNFNVGNKNFEN